jgi:hypothetical protein
MCLTDELPFAGGPHADVYKGEYRGRKMALKVLRIFGRPEDRDRFYQACAANRILRRPTDILSAEILRGGPRLAQIKAS